MNNEYYEIYLHYQLYRLEILKIALELLFRLKERTYSHFNIFLTYMMYRSCFFMMDICDDNQRSTEAAFSVDPEEKLPNLKFVIVNASEIHKYGKHASYLNLVCENCFATNYQTFTKYVIFIVTTIVPQFI